MNSAESIIPPIFRSINLIVWIVNTYSHFVWGSQNKIDIFQGHGIDLHGWKCHDHLTSPRIRNTSLAQDGKRIQTKVVRLQLKIIGIIYFKMKKLILLPPCLFRKENGIYRLSNAMFQCITLLNTYTMIFYPQKKMRSTNIYNLQLLVKNVIIHNPSALHKWQIPESNYNDAHETLGPTKHNQRAVMLCAPIQKEKSISHWDSNSIHN